MFVTYVLYTKNMNINIHMCDYIHVYYVCVYIRACMHVYTAVQVLSGTVFMMELVLLLFVWWFMKTEPGGGRNQRKKLC